MRDSRKETTRDERKFNHHYATPSVGPEDLKVKAELKEARAKAKLERPPRTAGVLYRYDENGALERVLTDVEKKELAEKEELRKVAKENREKHLKSVEKKKSEKLAAAAAATAAVAVASSSAQAPSNESAAVAAEVEPKGESQPELVAQKAAEIDPALENPATDLAKYLDQLEISSDDARQQSIEFVEVKSKRTISQERKEVKGKETSTLFVVPPAAVVSTASAVPPREKSLKKSTMEVIPPADDSPRPSTSAVVAAAPSKPAWQAPQATLEVLGVPSPAEVTNPHSSDDHSVGKDASLPKTESKFGKREKKVKERDPKSAPRRKREDASEESPTEASSRRGTGRVDTSAAKMHLARNTTTSTRQRQSSISSASSSRADAQEKVPEEEELKSEISPQIGAVSSGEDNFDLKVADSSEDQEEHLEAEGLMTSSRGRGRGRESFRGRGGRRGGRRDARISGPPQEENSGEAAEGASSAKSTWARNTRGGRREGGGGRGAKGRGPSLPRRGPPAQNPNPE